MSALDEGDEGEEDDCGGRSCVDGVVVVVDCALDLLWNHSHSRYLHVKSPSLPWEMESPQTSILTVLVSALEAIAADEGSVSVAASGSARPFVRGAAIMAMMAERSAEARILPRRGRLSDVSHHQHLANQYARKVGYI